MQKLYPTMILTFFLSHLSLAQDPINTQFYHMPEMMNPAFIGISNSWNAGLLHRRQWPNGNRKIDIQYGYASNLVTDNLAIGATILNQNEVFTNLNYTQVLGAVSYRFNLDYEWRLRFGLEAGMGRKDFNFRSVVLEDQINLDTGEIAPGTIDPTVLNAGNKVNFFDMNAGLLLEKENTWLGFSVKHLTRPNIAFTEVAQVPLDLLASIHGGSYFEFNNSPTSIIPDGTDLLVAFRFISQGKANRLDIGSTLEFKNFSFGVYAATNPFRQANNSHLVTSLNPLASFKTGEFTFGYSYDLNISRMGQTQGIHEFTLVWQSRYRCDKCDNYLVKVKRNGEIDYKK